MSKRYIVKTTYGPTTITKYKGKYKPKEQQQELTPEQKFEKMPEQEKAFKTFARGTAGGVLGVLTFPEFVAEEGVGRVHSLFEGKGLKPKDYFKGGFSRESLYKQHAEKYEGQPESAIGTLGVKTE